MKQRSWSVWCQGEDIEKVRKDQGRIENTDFTSSSDHKSDCIGTKSKETHGDRSLRSEQAVRAVETESQVEL